MAEFRVGNNPDKFAEPPPNTEFVFKAFFSLKDRFDTLEVRLTKSETENAILKAEIAELRSRLKTDSHNSSKPPSSDGPGSSPKPKSLRAKSGKKTGGQKGHEGTTLEKSLHPDQRQDHFPEGSCCGHIPKRRKWFIGTTRQDVDLPIIKPVITEHRFWAWVCPTCGQVHECTIPTYLIKAIQYGPRLTAYVIYLNVFQHMPYDRIHEMLATMTNIRLSQGTIRNMIRRVSDNLEAFVADIKQKIASSPLAQFDETGIMVDAINHWIHSASTATEVYYEPHMKRGKQAMDDIGILPQFHGVGVHDFWASYFRYGFSHSLCCAHLLRELVYQKEEMSHKWAGKLIRILRWMKRKRDEGESPGCSALIRAKKRWEKLISSALSHTPAAFRRKGTRGKLYKGKTRSLLERLRDYGDECLRFAFEHGVPFDNNLSERDIRMVKVKQKVSGGFRSFLGLSDFCRIRSYVATMRKRGTDALAALVEASFGRPMPVFAE